MIWFGWVSWHINYYWLFNARFCLYIYIKCIYDFWGVELDFMAYQPLSVN